MTKLKLLFITSLLLLTLLLLGGERYSDIALGALAQWSSNNYDATLVLPSTYPPRQHLTLFIAANENNLPFQIGRVIGATAVLLQGITEVVDGGRRGQLGILVCAESVGMGCVVGGVVTVSGAIEGVHGAVVVGQGLAGLGESSGQVLTMVAKGGGSHVPITNKNGIPYPEIIDPRTGQPIPEPPRNLSIVPKTQRVSWDGRKDRFNFIKQWHDKGYNTPEGGWEKYDIHHIIPREYGGTNDFDNLVPVLRDKHQLELNPWWSGY